MLVSINKKKLSLISLILILLISCSNEEAVELEKCKSTYRGIQEAYLQLGEIFPDEENTEVKFGEIYASLQYIWFYYAVQNFNDQSFIDIVKNSEDFNEELWNELENIDSREDFNSFLERPVSELLTIKSNLEALEPDLNNISNHGQVVRSVNQIIKATEDLKTDFPEVPEDLDEFLEDIDTNTDIAVDYAIKSYEELKEIDQNIASYNECSPQED